ncbi:hypothetical protein SELMODRAFT_431744 [Selaginella moellendorffii]|uniref:Mon2/Sec7/BIG1-like HDS domain-containing protein n=1 Tax=Selaginella moellendorffii TaxID=88036 RepID=D8TDM8_SELML|nr:hypothetical protein SELMODRAFT_431744 [Selaginella moellendorffii]
MAGAIATEVGDETAEPLESETDKASTESAVKDVFTTLSFTQEVEKIPEEVAKFLLSTTGLNRGRIRVGNIKSGWKITVMIFITAATDRDSSIIHLAFEPVEKVARNYFQHITETENTIFTDCVNGILAS